MLILLPNLIAENTEEASFTPIVAKKIDTLQGLIAESEKEGRRYLKRFNKQLPILLLNEHTKDLKPLIDPIKKGETWGLITDAGLPCLADPGYLLVDAIRKINKPIDALVGPSSIILALMLSGLPSQSFWFHGYLPYELTKGLKLEKSVTHLFIEAPYRNEKSFSKLLTALPPHARLGIAMSLMSPEQKVLVKSVSEWQKEAVPSFHKIPAIFLVYF